MRVMLATAVAAIGLAAFPACSAAPPARENETIHRAVRRVFDRHGFPPPTDVVDRDLATWYVGSRVVDGFRIDRLIVRVPPSGRDPYVGIAPYMFYASDWALLGLGFVDLRGEEREIREELSAGLRGREQPLSPGARPPSGGR
jgi:hypothetical protein